MHSFILLTALIAAEPAGAADEATQAQAEAVEVAAYARQQAASWELFLEGPKRTRVDFRSEPVLRWSNPEVGRVYGSVFLWTAEGRPVAAGTVYRWFAPLTDRTGELVTLTPRAITAEKNGRTLWSPKAGLVEFKPIPGAPLPEAGTKSRLPQIRNLAREFAPELADTRVTAEGTPKQLRLLDQPIFKYGPAAGGLLEGAVFAFAIGTDPEALLVIEARQTDAGRRWYYALARMNRDGMRVRHKDQEIWSVPYLQKPWADRDAPYLLFGLNESDDEK
jgi:hypothetical protein